MLPKINRGTLADKVTEQLLEYIDDQHLRPGDLLPSETSLSTSFGVSRPVVREALKHLEGKGVLDIINGKGALIRPIDSDPLRLFFQRAMQMERSTLLELMEVRKGLEVQAAMLAAQRREAKDIEDLRRVVQAMGDHIADPEAFTQLDVEYHLRIASASHNTMLVYLVESIRDVFLSTISTGLQSRGSNLRLDIIQNTHETLLQTIEEGDVEAAMKIMALHFDEAIAAITNAEI